jgi:cation:H+ antiporter
VLLGVSTSLSGTVTSITAAAEGQASLAISNGVGGIAVQTVFLAVADIFYRRVNLEHAAASPTNLLQVSILIVMLTLPLGAALTPEAAVWAVHPVTPLLVAVYIAGLRLTNDARERPMWLPRRTPELREDTPEPDSFKGPSTRIIVLRFCGLALALGVAGWAIAQSASTISAATGLTPSFVGALFTATTTSLPELVTTIAAVRRRALTLAVGGIIGGNTFDVLFLVTSDIAYRGGSVYHAVGERELFLIVWSMLMTGVLLMGLIRRETRGVAGIGFESALLLLIYTAGVAVQVWQL